ncbi:MAG: phosphate acetyltransferase [Candidatus Bostrichicola ureolyticus]|nr:MAG: phosphate acetyltransferase [Candidatus Bostrichicola ureolyticus]
MNKSVFITTATDSYGKSIITFGIIQMLINKKFKVGFLKPIIENNICNNYINTILSYFNINMSYKESFAFTKEEAIRNYLTNKNYFFNFIINKYNNLKKKFDFIIVEGTNLQKSIFDFNINNLIAKTIQTPIILIINGENKNIETIVNNILIEFDSIQKQGNKIIMIVINNSIISKQELECILYKSINIEHIIISIIPLETILEKPTINDLIITLNASKIICKEEHLNIIARKYILGAMQLNNYIDVIINNTNFLLLIPSDRIDIIYTTLLLYNNYPNKILGIFFTEGFLDKSVIRFIKDKDINIPIFYVKLNTFESISKLNNIKYIYPNSKFKIKLTIERFERYIDIRLLEQRIINFKSKIVNPQLFQYNIFNISKKLQKHIVLPEGLDERILCASSKFAANKLGLLTILGDKEKILIKVKNLGLFWDEKRIKIINPIKSTKFEEFYKKLYELRKNKGLQYDQAKTLMLDVSYFGTMMVYDGLADGMVSGVIHTTANTIRPALQIIKTIPTIKTVSSIFLMLLYDRVIIYGDCAIVPNPTSEQLAEIAICSAITAKSLGIEPKIAMLSYSSGDSGLGKEVDKVKNATIIVKKRKPELIIEGPIQYDAAVDWNIGIRKLPNSNVIGQANVFIFPDLNAGNNTYKAVQRETKTIAIGPILQGLNKPINDLSRGATVDDIYNTIIITTIQANENTNY